MTKEERVRYWVKMAIAGDSTVAIISRYIRGLGKNGIPILEAILFGYHGKGEAKPESDIDVALVSSAFTGDRF